MITVIMPIMVRSDYTKKALESLYKNSTGHFDDLVIFIDGLASDETISAIKEFYDTYDQSIVKLSVLKSKDWVGVNQARMQSMQLAKNSKLFIVNDDILVSHGWDKELNRLLETDWVVCPMFTLGDKDFA